MPSDFTQADVANLSAGDELNERCQYAVDYFAYSGGPFWPSLLQERIRRRLELPSPIPDTAYCGPDYSGDDETIEEVFGLFDLVYVGNDSTVDKARWLVVHAMSGAGSI